ncbi:helix-turn-helix transcriptional regulator [Winogradskya humida]|uniref:Transcriptional regulator n=1 Tax=Winogradskya humida TaxID=113566 RepID=A0ABQ3ZPL8_9ACTN|nr:helix-turn-helix transcriptional regulator [Actinoplanes humidus]GIE20459.1 transcriptional regulator [Actinoplanes humidus]
MAVRRSELGEFLRARRDRISPAQAGMEAFPGPRRVPGLRRDELAYLAGVSTDYLSRLEQGRQQNVSDAVLNALSRALRLTGVEKDHLRRLAAPSGAPRGSADLPQRADPGMLRLMTALDHLPALMLGHRGDILASNHLLHAVLGRSFEPGDSFTWFMFTDPLARERLVNWAAFASATVAGLRREAGERPHDARLRRMITKLRETDSQVDDWWQDQRILAYASVVKRIAHPVAGPLSFAVESVMPPHDPEQRLIVYTTEPDSPTARALPLLASYGVAQSKS